MRKQPRFGFVAITILAGLPLVVVADDKAPDLVGAWVWTWKDGQGETHRCVLDVERQGSDLIGRERLDEQPGVKVSDLKLDGKRVRYFVIRGDRTISYDGKFGDANTIDGMVTIAHEGQNDEFSWTARRKAK